MRRVEATVNNVGPGVQVVLRADLRKYGMIISYNPDAPIKPLAIAWNNAPSDMESLGFNAILVVEEMDEVELERDALAFPAKVEARVDEALSRGMARAEIHIEVGAECRKQYDKWGEQDHSPSTWLAIITEEVGEVAQEVLRNKFGGKDVVHLREELIQVAASAVSAIECLDKQVGNWEAYVTQHKNDTEEWNRFMASKLQDKGEPGLESSERQ